MEKMMNYCETCRFWSKQPDKVFQPTEWQKPDGPPIITVLGVCEKLNLSCGDPPEDGIAYDASHCADYGDEATTGPKFGCVHHQPHE